MTVFELKGQIVEVGPGVCGSEAEATATGRDGRDVFIYTWRFDGCRSYTVSDKSVYGTMTTEEFDEEKCAEHYEELEDAVHSKYYEVFKVLDQMVCLMEG